MEAVFVLVIWILMMFFSIRDTCLAYFKPKDFIQVIRNRRHRYLNLFPFLRNFIPYPDENFILQSNKVMLPIIIMFLIGGLIFVLIQILIRIK